MMEKARKTLSPLAFSVYGIVVMLFLAVLAPMNLGGLHSLFGAITQTQVVTEVNPHREAEGLLPLSVNPTLQQAAQMKAEDMLARNYFSHTGPNGESPWVWLDRAGYSYALAGENLAMDFFDSKLLVNAWLNSPSHARNIMNGYYTDIGIGVAEGELDGRNTTVAVMFVGKELTPTLQALNEEEADPEPDVEPESEQEQEPDPQVAGTTDEPTQDNSNAPPEEMATIQYVDDEVLETEKGMVLASGEPIDFRMQSTAGTTAFITSNAINILRTALSVFFVLLVLLTVYIAVRHREHHHLTFSIPRILALVVMATALWI